jgi:putative sigma-54 modulation protein
MLFTMTGRHIEVTDALRSHAEEKSEKLPRYFDSINHIEVILEGNNGGKPGVEIIVHAEHSNDFIAHESGDDMYACIDIAMHKLERQLHRKKEKQRNNKHIMGVQEIETEAGDSGEFEV